MTVINDQHQMGMHSRNGGAPSLGHGYAFRPAADQSQGRGHVFPVGQYGQSSRPSALGLIVLLNSGGLRLPHFSSFTHCARSSSSSDLTRIGRVCVPSLRTSGLPQFRSPRVGVRRGGCAFVAAPTSRLHFKPTNHVCQDNSDWSERHLQSAFRGRSSMTNHHPKGSEACSPNRGIPLP
jgi:hypothetical protein